MIKMFFSIRFFLLCILLFATFGITEANEVIDETDEIYWETASYLSKLENETTASKVQYVYHARRKNFIGNWIVPLNIMPSMEGFSEVYERAISKYKGREHLLALVIPTLNCLWNDVIFLSPLHPHKHYEEYKKLGFTPVHVEFFKIPVEVLKEKRVTVWKWLSEKKYPADDPIHDSLYSYADFNIAHYQELEDLPEDTKEYFRSQYDPADPTNYPKFNWYRIPHILTLDPIDLMDDRITIINWEDEIEAG